MAEELLVIEREIGDPGDQRPFDDVGGIEPSAEPNLEDAGVGRRSREGEKGGSRRHFEEARLDAGPASSTSVSSCASVSSSISRPATRIRSLKRTRCGLVNTWTLCPLAFKRRAEEGDGGTLAVGAGNVEDGRQPILRAAEPLENGGDTLETEPVAGRRKLRQSVELRLDVRMRRAREIGHQAASLRLRREIGDEQRRASP